MATKLVRPTNALGAGIFSTGNSPFGGTRGADFAVKVFEYQGQFSVPVVEVTGGDDTAPTFVNGGLTYGQFRLVGAMIAEDAVGFSTLGNQLAADGSSDITLTLNFDDTANRQTTRHVILDNIQISASVRQSAIVGVTVSGKYTDDVIQG
jgi:hypothetical protein